MRGNINKIILGVLMIALVIQWIPVTSQAEEVQSSTIQPVIIQVDSFKYPNSISAGDTFILDFTVRKDGNTSLDADSAYVELVTTEGLSLTAVSSRIKLKNFNNDGSNTYQAEFEVSPDVVGGKQSVTMNFIYQYNENGTLKEGSNTAKVRIPVNGATAPTLSFTEKQYSKNVEAGEKLTLSYQIKNNSTKYKIQNVSVSYTATEGLVSLQEKDSYLVDAIATGGLEKKSLSFRAAKTASANQSVTFTYKYDYTINNQVFHGEGSDIIAIALASTENQSNIPYVVVGDYSYGATVNAGENFDLKVKFKNSSKKDAIQNITITVGESEGLVSKEASNKIFINKVKKDGTTSKTLSFQTKDDAVSGYQTITFQIKYQYVKDGQTVEAETTEQANIQVKGKSSGADSNKSNVATPYMMVKSYDYGDKVAAGSNFNLHLDIQNTSESVNMENIVVSMETAEDLSITSSSNTFYIKKMKAGEVKKQDIEMQALASAKAMSSTITLNFKYEYVDEKTRTQVTSTEQISVPIYQPDRLNLELSPILEETAVGTETALSVQYVNKGKGTIYNVSAQVAGNADCAEPIQNLGNYEAGANGTIDFYVTPLEAGEISGQITVSYEDENMKAKSVEIPFSFAAAEAMSVDDMEGMDEGEVHQEDSNQSQGKTIVFIVAGILAAVIVIIVVIIIMKKRKKSKQLKLQALEDMMDDGEE